MKSRFNKGKRNSDKGGKRGNTEGKSVNAKKGQAENRPAKR
jgi:hypothetical protein